MSAKIELPERVSYDGLTGEEIDQDLLKHLESAKITMPIVLVCDECKARWRCCQSHWLPANIRQSCNECGAKKSVHQLESSW